MPRGRVARWVLEEIGRPYRTELLDYGTTMKAPEYLAINPMGKVPALRHGATVVTECAAICCYLADAFPDAGLAPAPGDRLRGPYYRWMFFAAGPLEAALAGHEYLVGDRFTAADVYVGSFVGWGMRFGTLEKSPVLERYFERISARPAAVRAREIDDALMPKTDQPSE